MSSNLLLYLQKRVARIVPGFLVASAATIAIAMSYGNSPKLSTFANIATLHPASLAGFPNNPMRGIIDGTLWTIRYEFDCYLLVAVLGVVGWLNRFVAIAVFAICALLYISQGYGLHIPSVDHGIGALLISSPIQWPRFFMFFWAGAAFYLWRNIIPKSPVIALAAVIFLFSALRWGGAEIALVTAGTYLLFWIALSTAAVPQIGNQPVDLSYGMYLYGFSIQQALIAFVPGVHPLSLFVASLVLTATAAYFSWQWVERPALAHLRTPLYVSPS